MADPDFGTDVHCVDSIDARVSSVSGKLALAEACARRLSTPLGRLWYDDDYGHDLRQYLNGIISTSQISANIQAELLKEERIDAVSADVTPSTGLLTITIGVDTADGPFDLVLAVSSVGVEIVTFN